MDVDVAGRPRKLEKKPKEKNTREGKGAAGGLGKVATPEQPSLYPRVSASCLKKKTTRGCRRKQEAKDREKWQEARQTQARHSLFPCCSGEFACAF